VDGTVGARRVGPLRIELAGEAVEYDWEPWTSVRWHERRKAGWATLARAYASTASRISASVAG
jgi:hypothetical protein